MYNAGVEIETAKLTIKLFGQLTVSENGSSPVRVPSGKLAALFGALAINLGTAITRENLAVMIWPDLDAASARRNLRQQVFVLKQFLDQFSHDILVVDPDSLLVRSDSSCTDLQIFMNGMESDDEECWIEAIAVRTGKFLEELDEPATNLLRHRLDEGYMKMLFKLINLRHSQGQIVEALEFAKLARLEDPLSERAAFAMVRLFHAKRQFAMAKAEYENLERALSSEAGSRPSLSYQQLISKPTNGSQSFDLEDFSAPTLKADSPVRRSNWRGPSAVIAVVALTLAGFLYTQKTRPVPSYEDLKTRFEVLSSEEVSKSNREAQGQVLAQIAELAWKDAYGKREIFWQNELGPHMQKMNEIMDWCSKNRPLVAIQIGGALERYYLLVSDEHRWGNRLGEALELAPSERTAVYARALYTWVIANPSGDANKINARLNLAQDIYQELGDQEAVAQVVRVRGFYLAATFHPIEARSEYEKALALNQQANSEKGKALCNFCLAVMGRDPNENFDEDLVRQTRHAIEAFDGFTRIGNVWGQRSSAGLIANFGLALKVQAGSLSVLRNCRAKLLSAADIEQSLSNNNGELDNVSKAVLISLRIGDKADASSLLIRIASEGFGSGLSSRDRYLLLVASSKLSRPTFIDVVGNVDPFELTKSIESQHGMSAVVEARQMAKTLKAEQIVAQIIK